MPKNPHTFPGTDEASVAQTERNDSKTSVFQEAHERFGIDRDAPEIVERTIEKNGFTSLELEEPHTLPTLEEWVTQRMAQGYSGYNYGTFVMNDGEQIGFAKVHYGTKNLQTLINDAGEAVQFEVGGPQREQAVLEALASNGYDVPEVLGYNPASPEDKPLDEKMYEMLVIEAVLPEYGAVRVREEWTPQLARIAAQKIATFVKPAQEVPLFENESVLLPAESLINMLPRTGDTYDEVLGYVLEAYPHIDEPIVVHGDTWFNNIIARHDNSDVMFVDWELAGPGYKGQDAGRKLWDLTIDSEWQPSEYTETAEAFANEWRKTDDDLISLKFGVMYESLRWISERVRDINKPGADEATITSLTQSIEDVKNHALKLLENIDDNNSTHGTTSQP
jgi:hypothetical protein